MVASEVLNTQLNKLDLRPLSDVLRGSRVTHRGQPG